MMTNNDREKLRRLALAVQAGAGDLYNLDWRSSQMADEFGICPRVELGGIFSAKIRIGCYSESQAQTMQQLADYLALLTPATVLELLDNVL